MPAVASRVDMILEQLVAIVGATIVQNEILPPTSARFPKGWIITAGYPDADEMNSVRDAAEDGGYTVAINAIEPTRPSRRGGLRRLQITLNDGTTRRRVARRVQRVQITSWAANDDMRDQIGDAVLEVVGTDEVAGQWLTLPDGTSVYMEFVSGPRRTDEPIAETQIKRVDVLIDIDYGVLSAPVETEVIDQTQGVIEFPTATVTVFNPPE